MAISSGAGRLDTLRGSAGSALTKMRPVRHRHRLRVRKSQAVRRSPPRPTTLTIRQLTITTTTCLPVENKQPRSRHSSPPFTAEYLGKRIRQKVEALWRDEVNKGLRFGTLLVLRGCAGLMATARSTCRILGSTRRVSSRPTPGLSLVGQEKKSPVKISGSPVQNRPHT